MREGNSKGEAYQTPLWIERQWRLFSNTPINLDFRSKFSSLFFSLYPSFFVAGNRSYNFNLLEVLKITLMVQSFGRVAGVVLGMSDPKRQDESKETHMNPKSLKLGEKSANLASFRRLGQVTNLTWKNQRKSAESNKGT